ncbi:MAG: hypothetical protein M0P31_07625 [Solirubrobacteraceae bacterium]|nr:hypothetical protein [Solirubrobacteraceae bacterium]
MTRRRPHLPYRTLAVTAATAVAAGGTASMVATAATAAPAAPPVAITQPAEQYLLGLDLGGLLSPILDSLPGGLGDIISDILDGTIGGALGGGQLDSVLSGLPLLDPSQFITTIQALLGGGQFDQILAGLPGSGMLGSFDLSQLQALFSTLPFGNFAPDLAGILPALDPTQLLGVLNTVTAGPLGQLLDQVAAGPFAQLLETIVGGGPDPAPHTVAGLLQRLTAFIPADVPVGTAVTQLRELLAPVTDLLKHAGIDSLPFVSQLLNQLESLSASLPSELGEPVAALIGDLRNTEEVLSYQAALANGATPAAAGAPAAAPVAATPVAKAAAYRVTVKRVSLNKAKNRVTVKLSLSKKAPETAKVKVSTRLAGKVLKTRTVNVRAGKSKTVRISVPKATARKVVSNGGKARVRATTVGSSKAAHVKSVNVKRTKR